MTNKKNEWAIILGGSSGLGYASALKLAKHGFNICILHRDRKSSLVEIDKGFEAIQALGIKFLSFNVDALNAEKRKAVLDELKFALTEGSKVSVLVHSIAKGNLKPMAGEESTLRTDDFQITIEAMAISLYDWVKAIFDKKMFAAEARIISFTSEGNKKAWKQYAAVSAAKAALEAISRNIALEFAPYGITSNCIQSGVCDTASFRLIPNADELVEHSIKRNPFGRLTTAEDVANVVYLLTTKEAKWINGTVIPVDGGESLS